MSAISIVINAVNNAKAAFESVGNQTIALNKKLNKAAGVMRSLFAVGIAAKFVKDLVGASSETEKLEGIIGRIKERFGDAATTIGDGLVAILGFLEAPIIKIADFIGAIIDGIKKVAAVAAAVLTGSSFKEALNIADEVLAAEKAERAARIEAKKTAEMRKKLDEEVANNAIKEAERVAKEREKLEQEIGKLQQSIADQQNKMAEAQMTDAELLAKRKGQAEKAYNDYVTALLEGRKKDELTAFNEYLKLQEEILQLERKINEEAQKTTSELEKQTKEKQAQIEADKLRAQAQEAETAALEQINKLEQQRVMLLQKQSELITLSENLRKQAVDVNFRKESRKKEREEAREQSRFDNLLASAKRIEAINAGPGLRRGMSESERLALESERARMGAGEAGELAERTQEQIAQLQEAMVRHLESIDKQITDVLALKES
jgi:hypothetical protein